MKNVSKILKIPSLEYRRIRGDLIETFKITHKFYDSRVTGGLFTLSKNNSTRSNGYKLEKNSFNSNQYKQQAQRRAAAGRSRHKSHGVIQYQGSYFPTQCPKWIFVILIVLVEKKYTKLIYHMPWLYQYPPLPFHRSYKN